MPKTVRILLEPSLRRSAEAGRHNFIRLLANLLEQSQFRVEFCDPDAEPCDYAISHMKAVGGPNSLVFRRVYHYPFWQIDSASERWRWDTARAVFDATASDEARRFHAFWQRRLWGAATAEARKTGFIYVPLQGRLLQQRSFQRCTPLEMIEAALVNTDKPLRATLHPRENYSDAERDALARLMAQSPRLALVEDDMASLLRDCDAVVTQNSAAAFNGYFFGKPAMLFAEIDFHHIAVKADMVDPTADFARLETHQPDFAAYLHWFWQLQSVNAGHPDAEAKIAARLRRYDWPV